MLPLPRSPLWPCLAALLHVVLWAPPGLHAQETNIAVGKAISASGPLFGDQGPELLVDGDPATFAHSEADAGTLGFTYEIDLGDEVELGRIEVLNRTGCCPERLSNYRVSVFADGGGAPGVQRWSVDVRTDGSDSGDGGRDLLTADLDAAGTFAGRFLHIVNLSDAPFNPQIAEVEVYAAPRPQITIFKSDAGNITKTGDPTLPLSTELTWVVEGADSITISEIGSVAATGSQIVSPDITTTYVLTATNSAGERLTGVTVGVDESELPPVLNEFMADNVQTLDDQEGDSEDWIEIYNPNSFTQTLTGYYLTDDPDNLTKWQFPVGSRILRDGYLVVFASDKDLTDPSEALHTNFKLAKPGGYLALVAPNGLTIVGKIPADHPVTPHYPPQKEDRSYGLDAAGAAGFFDPSTPGAENGQTVAGFVADTEFDINRGFFDAPIAVEITSMTPGASIRYTTDGSKPTETRGTLYTGPVAISTTTTLRAIAYKTGLASTNVDTHTYIYVDDVLQSSVLRQQPTLLLRNALVAIPSLSIVTPENISGSSEVETSFELIFPDGTEGFQEDCGVKEFGGAFTDFPKRNFRMYFRSQYGAPKLRYPIFEGFERGIAAPTRFDQLNLRSGSHDMSRRGFYMSNRFTDDTMLDMGNINPHGRFMHLYLNGTYWGQYHVRERWNASTLSEYLGGPKEAYEAINGNWNVGGWADSVIDAYDGDGRTWERVKSVADDYEAIQLFNDVQHYIDYMLMFMYGNSEDEYRCVGPAGIGSGFKWFLNDADGFLRSAGNRTGFSNQTIGLPGGFGRSNGDGPGSIFSLLFKSGNSDYRTLLADRIHKHFFNDGAMTPGRNTWRLRERMSETRDSFRTEALRWNNQTYNSWNNGARGAYSNIFPTRTDTVVSQFRNAGFYPSVDAPVLNQHGGSVPSGFLMDMTAPRGDLYYTLDGTDPRLPGRMISPTAILFDGAPIALTLNTLVKMRALSAGQWSALNEAFFLVGGAPPVSPGELSIAELHYNPAGSDNTEFLELLNASTQAINLRSVVFTDGIDFSFPDNRDVILVPGERLLLVDSQFAMDESYGRGLPIGGVFRGNLDNDGERIEVETGDGTTLLDFTYNDKNPWPEEADDAGFSLTLTFPGADPADPGNWRLSNQERGTPGTSDTTPFTGNPDADLDGDGYCALAEHALGTSDLDPLDTSGALRLGFDGDGHVTAEFPRDPTAGDVETIVEVSTDLATWTTGPAFVEFVSLVGNLATYRAVADRSAEPTLFVRLRFVQR